MLSFLEFLQKVVNLAEIPYLEIAVSHEHSKIETLGRLCSYQYLASFAMGILGKLMIWSLKLKIISWSSCAEIQLQSELHCIGKAL
jgi:hypothetical protein